MKVYVCPSSAVGVGRQQVLASYLINDTVLIDAGCAGFGLSLAQQQRIRHVFLSHSHLDHVASLPMLIEHVAHAPDPEASLTVYASRETLECLKRHVFNDAIWPDFVRLSEDPGSSLFGKLVLRELLAEMPVQAAGLRVTPVPVCHTVPTFAYVVEEPGTAIGIISDTAPTERVWELLNSTGHLKAVFLEASFPDRLGKLAQTSHHLTPSLFFQERAKLRSDARVFVIHMKAAFAAETWAELKSQRPEACKPAKLDYEYRF
ncbi:MAG: 3',5'-cyclic-nucleotide phosphodiesterase [Planctomycetes bacterium]|nr:3',5'-cyclic-nucleotide phosphodiesterase [Planctomycetota bacterium]